MIDDIFSAQFHFEDPSGASSVKVYYQQTVNNTAGALDTRILAEALEDKLDSFIVAALADTFWFTGITVRLHYDDPQPKWLQTGNPQQGTRTGPGLPSNNCVQYGLMQSTFPIKSNGRIFFPGVPEPDTNVGVLAAAYQSGACTDLAVALADNVVALSDTGEWSPGVISQKVLNLTPPTKDWAGAFAFVDSISPNPIIAIQRRRTTRVVGAIG